MRRSRLLVRATVLVCLLFSVVEAFLLNARIRDYDEGVYWQSIRAMARGEPLFSSVFASQPPAFYYTLLPPYLIAHSVVSLRLSVLVLGVAGLVAVFMAGRMLAGTVAGFVALVLTATSPLYFHESAILQADGPAVALSVIAFALALVAVRHDGQAVGTAKLTRRLGAGRWVTLAPAAAAGFALALATGTKLLGAVTVLPIAIVLLGAGAARWRLLLAAVAGGVLGLLVVLIPVLGAPGAALDQLVLGHLRAGQAVHAGIAANLKTLFLRRELPLELLAVAGVVIAIRGRDRAMIAPLVWAAVSVLAVLLYQPLFPHHLVMLSPVLALVAAVGIARIRRGGWRLMGAAAAGRVAGVLVVIVVAIGAVVCWNDDRLALTRDIHDAEMTSAVQAASRPGDFWISDNPWAVAAANRDIPGPMVDTSRVRTISGLLTVNDLEAARVKYNVRLVLSDSFRLNAIPGFSAWLGEHYRAVQQLGGRAVIYQR